MAILAWLGIVSGALAVAGVILNNRKLIWCFPLWLVSNSVSAYLHVHSSMWGLAARDAIFLGLAIEGWLLWKTKRETEEVLREEIRRLNAEIVRLRNEWYCAVDHAGRLIAERELLRDEKDVLREQLAGTQTKGEKQ